MGKLIGRFNKQTYIAILSFFILALWNMIIGGNLFGYVCSIAIYIFLMKMMGIKLLDEKENGNDNGN